MEHQELESLKPVLESTISEEQLLKGLTMPVEAKINDLIINANQIEEDAESFSKFGLNWEAMKESILTSVFALRSAETLYTVTEQESAEADLIWRENREKLYSWRDEATARLTFHATMTENEALQKSIDKISLGEGHPDAIQDGHETIELVERHREGLRANNLSDERIAEAKEIVALVSDAYPKVAAGAEGDKSAKELRDRAYWYCCSLEKDLKEKMLPLVFFDNYKRRQEYGSNYKRSMK